MKKQLLAALVATVATLAGLALIPFYEDCGGAILASAAVALGALRFI